MAPKSRKPALAAEKPADEPKIPPPPKGLKTSGKHLWKALHGELPAGWSFDGRELAALENACRLLDRFDQLNSAIDGAGVVVEGSQGQPVVHPALGEARQTAGTIRSLLDGLEIPNAEGQPETAASARARNAANVRWSKKDQWSREAVMARKRRRGTSN